MAFKSKAQMRKCAELVKLGALTQKEFDEMLKDTPDDIPERVPPKNKGIIRRPRTTKGLAK